MTLLYGFILVFVRLSALMAVAPMLGHQAVPWSIRQLLALTLAVAVTPLAIGYAPNLESIDLVRSLLQEMLTGALMGLGILIIMSAATMIGAVVGQLSGVQSDDGEDQSIAFGQQPTDRLIAVTALAAFVLWNGPELLLATVVDSFHMLPAGQPLAETAGLDLLVSILRQSFELTVRGVAPAVAAMLASTVVVGMLARTIPQLNLIQVGISSNVGVMLLAVFLTLGGCIWLTLDGTPQVVKTIQETLQSSATN
jgi:flagellar biosynthetic protein FliR